MGFLGIIPLRYWAYLGLFAAMAGAGWAVHHHIDAAGYSRCRAETKAEMADAIARAGEEARKIALQDAEVLNAGEKHENAVRTVFRNIYLAAPDVPERADCGLSPAGIVLWNRANHTVSTSAADTGIEGSPGESTARPKNSGDGRGDAGKPHPGDGTVLDSDTATRTSTPNVEGARPASGW